MIRMFSDCCRTKRVEPLVARLDEFRSIKPGWWEGYCQACDPQGLDWLAECFTRYYPDCLLLPEVFPTEEGNISAEWNYKSLFVAVEFYLTEKKAELFVFDKPANQSSNRNFPLTCSQDVLCLFDKLKVVLPHEW